MSKRLFLLSVFMLLFSFCGEKAELPTSPGGSINEGGEVYIALNFEADILITSLQNEEVVVDTTASNLTLFLELGYYNLTVSKPGFESFTEDFEVLDNDIMNFDITLSPLSADSLWIVTEVPKQDTVGNLISINWTVPEGSIVNINPQVGIRQGSGSANLIFTSVGQKIITFNVSKGGNAIFHRDTIDIVGKVDPDQLSLSFGFEYDTVYVNQDVKIIWNSNGDYVNIDHGIGQKASSGERILSFSEVGTEIFACTVFKDNESITKKDTLFVIEQPNDPLELTLQVNPTTVSVGEDVTISWNSNGDYVELNHGIGRKGSSGSTTLSFSEAGTETITCTAYRDGYNVSEAVTVVVDEEEPIEDLDLTLQVNPVTVSVGEDVTISWNSNGDYVELNHGIGRKGSLGSTTLSFSEAGTEMITCTAYRDDESVTENVTVQVIEETLPSLTLNIDKEVVGLGESITVTWSSEDADYLESNFLDNMPLNGSETLTFNSYGEHIVSVTAYNNNGQITKINTVKVARIDIERTVNVSVDGQNNTFAFDVLTVDIENAGNYEVFALVDYNSDENNESFFIQTTHNGNTETPTEPNLVGLYNIVVDERSADGEILKSCGVFYMPEGENGLDVYHYGQISGNHPDYLDGTMSEDEVTIKKFVFRWIE
jgi:hypothetical protein